MVCLLNLSVHGGHLQTILQQIFSTYIIIFHPSFQVTQKTSKKKKKNKNGFISHVLHHQGVGDLVSLFCVLFCGYTICYFSLNNIKKKLFIQKTTSYPFLLFLLQKVQFFGCWRVEWAIERRSDHGYWKIVFLLYPPLSLP